MKALIKALHRVLAEEDHSIYTDPSGKYWGTRGAGVIFRAKDTGRYLLAHRSKYVNEPGTWGVWGGKIDNNSETPKQAAMREVREEAGFRDAKYSIKHLHQFKDGDFIFDTFLVEVDAEFEPKLDWETQDFGWFEKSKFPPNLHFGLKPLLPKLTTVALVTADAGFMQKLNAEFAKIMAQPAFQKTVIKDAREYSHDMSADEVLERAFGEIYPKWMEDLERRGKFIKGKLQVYRGISVKNPQDIDYKNIGVYWTWDEAKAANYSDSNTALPVTVVKGLVGVDDINLKETLSKLVWPGYEFEESEREIHTKPRRVEIPVRAVPEEYIVEKNTRTKATARICGPGRSRQGL